MPSLQCWLNGYKRAVVVFYLAVLNILALVAVVAAAYFGIVKLVDLFLIWLFFMISLSWWSFRKWHMLGLGLSIVCLMALVLLHVPSKLFVYGVQWRFDSHLKNNPIQITYQKNTPRRMAIEKAVTENLGNVYSAKSCVLLYPNPEAIELGWREGFGSGIRVIIREDDFKVTNTQSKETRLIVVEHLRVRVTAR